jgi:hypothetical protein
MLSRKNERKVQPLTDDHAPSAAHSPQPLYGAEGVATSGLDAESDLKIFPLPDLKIHPAETVTSSPKEGEQIGARIPVQDAASTASKDSNALKPPKQMLSDWKWRLKRSASNAGSTEFDRQTCLNIYTECDREVWPFRIIHVMFISTDEVQ